MRTPARQIIAGAMIYLTVIGQVFGQAALLPNAEQQFLDNNGKPLASGSVTYYVPGTSTPKTTWTNSTQTANNLNPVPLDIGGKGIMYGQGSYRQVVKDANNNVIWDQPTTAYGASQPSGATGTDTAPVGSVMAYSGFVIPTNWMLAYGEALSRTTFSALMAAITISAPSISCINTSTTLTGFADTSIIRVGAPIEATCLPTSTTVASITNATTIVVSQAAASTSTVTATIFPWGNGDQVTTFNVPDYRGRAPVGADCMGYVASGNACAGNLTATYYGSNPGAPGQVGGSQSKNLTIANINAFTPSGTISAFTPSGTVTGTVTSTFPGSITGAFQGGSGANAFTNSGTTNVPSSFSGSFAGVAIQPTFTGQSLGSGTAHSIVNPDATTNYIIKVAANSTGAGGVVSFGGMFGDIVCASTLTCAPIGTVNTVGCTTATTSQLGCVEPDGTTITISGGVITAIAGVASSVGIGSTTITAGTNTNILYDNGGVLGQLSPSGTGSVCMTTNCVMTTPNLGTPSAATLTNGAGLPFSTGMATATISAPSTPASANIVTWLDSTDLRFHDKNASGVIGTTVVGYSAVSHQFLTGMNANGTFAGAQPAITDISGLGTGVATFLATPSSANLAAALTNETGTGLAVFGTSPTLTTPVISSIVNTGTLTLPTSTDTLVGRATTDTLTNKTLTSPTINGGALSGTFSGTPTLSGANFITRANLAQVAASSLSGNPTGSLANESAVTLGSTLNFSGTTLNCTSASATQVGCVEPDNVTITVVGGKIVASGGSATTITVAGTTVGGGTANGVLYNNGTLGNTAAGSVGQHLGVTGSTPTFKSGGWELLNSTGSQSAVSAVQDTTSFGLGYSEYEIVIEGLACSSTTASPEVQVLVSGSPVATGYTGNWLQGNGSAASSGTISTGIPVGENGICPATTAIGTFAKIYTYSPSVSAVHAFNGLIMGSAGSNVQTGTTGGIIAPAAVLSGFQLVATSGTVTITNMKTYGRL